MITSASITGASFLAGEWIMPAGETFSSFDPKEEVKFGQFGSCGPDEVQSAVHAAAEAFQVTRTWTGKEVATFLRQVAQEIEALGEVLLQTADRETGLGIPRLTGERGRTCSQIRAFADLAERGEWVQASIDLADPERTPFPKPDLRRMMRPLGPVAVFGASNFPFAFGALGGDTASAWAAGNPVVVKGHPAHPATSELFAQAVEKAIEGTGAPAGIFSLLQGTSHELGRALVKHPVIEAVGFTGSLGGGRALMDLAAARTRPIPVFAEMGSINPIFIGPNTLKANAKGIATGLAGSVCLGTGQFCTSPGVVVTSSNEVFEHALAEAMHDAPRGTLLHAGIAQALAAGLDRLKAHEEVEAIATDGYRGDTMTPPNSAFMVSAEAFLADPRLSEEIFGPVTLIVDCQTEAQMLEVACQLEGNLTASIHADHDPDLRKALLPWLEQAVGRVIFNGYPTGVEVNSSQQHGGPYPSTSAGSTTSVGMDAIVRFARFVAFQNAPEELLPDALKSANPLGISRKVNGVATTASC
ncbi:aldehyde dehydrogenase (NADP(+)) [Pontibacter sp. G13]|uniref:aldehyde dehydrogenase (NADP(+)) n=1 Tax=Pontibacter sp. G13 TaxID=3074898 RepID=UPI002889C211|nr:aldehyde dehydrogenase (NADP(+)) [Pontibacter sp. G13]WNJ18446.1 aldehyde dehydrogenase (NADP(+)) [Pontibacter sp. G13]